MTGSSSNQRFYWKKYLIITLGEDLDLIVIFVRNKVRTADQDQSLSDSEIIEQAAEAGSQIVLRHQREIAALIAHEETLLLELETAKKLFITQYPGGIVKEAVDMTVKEQSSTLKDLAAVRAQRIVGI